MSNEPKTFCKAPFKTTVIDTDGALLPCCEFMTYKSKLDLYKLNAKNTKMFKDWWEKGLDPLREKMLNGEIDPGCEYCISKEKNPNISNLRIETNNKIPDTFEEIKNDYLQNKREYPKHVELRLGNYCNLKCIMCGPYASSSILAEYKMNKKQYNEYGIESNWQDPNMPNDWYSYEHNKEIMLDLVSKASMINFGGGEPFISPAIVEVLNSISPKTYLSFNTNMTRINDKVLETLKKFDTIDIQASIDGTGQHNDYIRYGSKWNSIVENFKKLKTCNNISVNVYYILGHTSLFTLKDVIAFAEDINVKLSFGEMYHGSVDSSGHLTINSASINDINNFKTWFNSCSFKQKDAVQTWLDSYKPNANLHNRFKEYVNMLDSIRGTNFIKTFNPSWT
jgi:molybdenum cofactor biosynthesis enzyme MoaA